MKKNLIKYVPLLIFFSLLLLNDSLFGQAKNQISFGVVGAAWEIPVADDITVGPAAFTDFDFHYLMLGAKANYYFDRIWNLSDDWDVYAGVNAGFAAPLGEGRNSDVNLGAQIGGRWFWSEQWGLYIEFGGGTVGGIAGLGVTLIL